MKITKFDSLEKKTFENFKMGKQVLIYYYPSGEKELRCLVYGGFKDNNFIFMRSSSFPFDYAVKVLFNTIYDMAFDFILMVSLLNIKKIEFE